MFKLNKLNKVNKYNYASIGELPLTYKESLSYEEQLMWFCKNLKELIDNADNQNNEIEEAINYMKNNIEQTTINIINKLVEDNLIRVETTLDYIEEDEEIIIGGVVSE